MCRFPDYTLGKEQFVLFVPGYFKRSEIRTVEYIDLCDVIKKFGGRLAYMRPGHHSIPYPLLPPRPPPIWPSAHMPMWKMEVVATYCRRQKLVS